MGMTIEEAIEFKKHGYHTPLSSFKNMDDMDAQISKCAEYDRLALDTMCKYQQLENFARWVAEEIIDEDMWTLNHLAFAELACRKLVKLGIMQESNGEYLYEVVEDGKTD